MRTTCPISKGAAFCQHPRWFVSVRFLVIQWEQCNQLCRIAQNLAEDRAQRHQQTFLTKLSEPTFFTSFHWDTSGNGVSLNPWLKGGSSILAQFLPFPIQTFPNLHISFQPSLSYPFLLVFTYSKTRRDESSTVGCYNFGQSHR